MNTLNSAQNVFTITKTEPEKQYVFGWASVAKRVDGTEVSDFEGDVITPEELERAAYTHVLQFRSTGERHDPELRAKGDLIESCVFTKEKQAAIGIPEGTVPEGWWCGYHITDPETWAKIKSGQYRMFSVEGKGERKDYDESEVTKSFLDCIEKYNPFHDKLGQFSSGNYASSFSTPKNPRYATGKLDENHKAFTERNKKYSDAQQALGIGNGKSDPDQDDTRWMGGTQDTTFGRADPNAEANIKIANAPKPAAKPKKPRIAKPEPERAGKTINWSKMSDDEFVSSLEKTMPGIGNVINKGWASKNSAYNYIEKHKNGDMVLTDIYKERGYNGKPKVVDKATIKAYIQKNGTPELYRGMGASSSGQTGSQKQDRFANDKLNYAGLGVLGNGTYAAQTPPNSARNYGLDTARAYSNRALDGTVRMTLKKGTITASYDEVLAQQKDFTTKVREAIRNGKMSQTDGYKIIDVCEDAGRFGALRGYEAWYDNTGMHSGATPSDPYWVITNRSKVIIQKERYT